MFRVEWLHSALDELAVIWMEADSAARQAITTAAYEIDQRLQSDPNAEGESRPENRRVTFVMPLVVMFRVEAEGNVATVLHIWRYPAPH